jgi:hypothetical protein
MLGIGRKNIFYSEKEAMNKAAEVIKNVTKVNKIVISTLLEENNKLYNDVLIIRDEETGEIYHIRDEWSKSGKSANK